MVHNLFIGWSGEKSKAVGIALKNWLPLVIQAIDPWISEDADKGSRWFSETTEKIEMIKENLEATA
jgi:hypothetical protein